MTTATTSKQVYDVVKNNGAVRMQQQPSEAQLRLYSHLVIEKGARFEVSDFARRTWSGRTKHQMSLMINALA